MKISGLISLLVAAAILFASCVSINLPEEGTVPETESDAPETERAPKEYDYDIVENNFIHEMNSYLSMLGNSDFGGTELMIATPSPSLIDGDDLGITLSEDIRLRNEEVEEKLNIKLTAKKVSPDAMYDSVYTSCMTGEYFADIIMIPQNSVWRYARAGILSNLGSLPFSDFESGFNIKSGVEAASSGTTCYAVAGWATLSPDSLPAVFFNKELAKGTGLEDLYSLSRSGEWTWDKFFEYCAAVAPIDGISTYGTQNCDVDFADIVYFSEGNRFVESGLGKSATVVTDAEYCAHTLGTGRRLYDDPKKQQNVLEAIKEFANGSTMFLIDRLGTMKSISTSDAVWGILPMPKKDASQENYCTLVPSDSLMFAVPAGISGAEKVSRTISALNICSLGYSVDAYLTDAMYFYLRDNSSIDSAERICYSATWDMAYSAEGYDVFISESTYFAIRDVFENDHDLGRYVDTYASGGSSSLRRIFS